MSSDYDRRRHEMQIRGGKFGVDNAADFTGIATARFAELVTINGSVAGKMAAQESGYGESAQQFEVKDTCRENLRDEMSEVSRTSKAMEYAFDGIQDKFFFRRNLPDVQLLAKARAFIDEATPYTADFIAYGLPASFINDLTAAADAFEASFTAVVSATAEHIAARAEIAAELRQGMVVVRILDGIVLNRYANDPGKRAAWIAASHVEKAPKKKEDPPTPPTPPTP